MATVINGNAIGNGVNLQPSYYFGGNVHFGWDLMKQYQGIETVRIEIDPTAYSFTIAAAASWIREAKQNGYEVIATYHNSHKIASSDANDLVNAANWWKTNYTSLGGNFIINLMNEWGGMHNMNASTYAKAYNKAIPIVRKVYSGDIVIDLPGWGQDSIVAAKASNLITDQKVVLSAHIYQDSWNGKTNFSPADIDTIVNTSRPCIVGEFGLHKTTKNSCNWQACIDYANQKALTVLGWCWNGDGSEDGFLYNMASPSWTPYANPSNFSVNPNHFNTIYNKLV